VPEAEFLCEVDGSLHFKNGTNGGVECFAMYEGYAYTPKKIGIGTEAFTDMTWSDKTIKIQGSRAGLGLYSTGSLATIALTAGSNSSTAMHLNYTSAGNFVWYSYTRGATAYSFHTSAGQARFGIGIETPESPLDVRVDANNIYTSYMYNTSTAANAHGLNVQTATTNSGAYAFRVNSATNSNALVVKGNAHVGINKDSPEVQLHVVGQQYFEFNTTTTEGTKFENNTSGGTIQIGFQQNDTDGMHHRAYIKVKRDSNGTYGGKMEFFVRQHNTAAQLRSLTLRSNGYVAILKETPSYQLDVTGSIRATSDVIAFSDRRVKENIVTIDSALEKVTKLRGVTYTRKDIDDKSTKVGVIAQEVLDILPEVVEKDDEGKYSVAYGNMAGVFIEAIKELKAEVDSLKQEIKQLKK
jgi:hypothetical protein